MEKAPTLSFQCPKLWQDMPGSETKRFCDECGHHVQNLSLLGEEARNQLLQRAKTERICGTYVQDLQGNLITADSPELLYAKSVALRLAARTSTSSRPPEIDDRFRNIGALDCGDEEL